MDWTPIITTLIAALVPTGGFLGLFTIREKKTEMMLTNASKLIEGWMQLANERQQTIKEKENKLEDKDEKIDEQYRINSSLRHKLDDANTKAAVAEVMICDKMACGDRNPPFGTHMHSRCGACKEDKVEQDKE